ncbi:hypothetical protein Tco_1030826 [Tanacetum coccineum]|uniref:DUF4283 domain-containing protein n=1 Tax=Tanacetum coccineum TaxID=301880 RepID=A0ABQ5G7B1_9ASTR
MEKGLLSLKRRGRGNGVKKKQTNVYDVPSKGNDLLNLDTTSVSNVAKYLDQNAQRAPQYVTNTLGANTRNSIRMGLILENIRGDDVNSNANVEPTTNESLLASMSFATLLKGDTSWKSVNFCTLITPQEMGLMWLSRWSLFEWLANGLLIRIMVSFWESGWLHPSKNGLDAMLENGPWFIRNNPLILKNGIRMSSNARALIELRADMELKDTIVVAMPKLVGEGFYMCTIRVEYEWKPPRQATKGVLVGLNVSFKSTKPIYRPVSNNNGASTSSKKKQAEVSRQVVSNSNPFDALNSIENDDDLVRMRGFQSQNPLVPTRNVDSESEVEVVFDETANLMVSMSFRGGSDKGYGTIRLLKKWRETKWDDDYDPYDADLYESHDMSDHL